MVDRYDICIVPPCLFDSLQPLQTHTRFFPQLDTLCMSRVLCWKGVILEVGMCVCNSLRLLAIILLNCGRSKNSIRCISHEVPLFISFSLHLISSFRQLFAASPSHTPLPPHYLLALHVFTSSPLLRLFTSSSFLHPFFVSSPRCRSYRRHLTTSLPLYLSVSCPVQMVGIVYRRWRAGVHSEGQRGTLRSARVRARRPARGRVAGEGRDSRALRGEPGGDGAHSWMPAP